MKKITFALLGVLFTGTIFAQTYTTDVINLSSTSGLEYSAQIDVTATEVTLTLIGPDDRWLGLGLGVNSMTAGEDVVIFDGTTLTDRTYNGIGNIPSLDGNSQDWSVSSNIASGGVRTLVATRALDTGVDNDYVFTAAAGSINLVWARGNGATFTLGYHGFSNKGILVSGITLGVDEFNLVSNFKILPNPASSEFSLELPQSINTANIEVYNVIGKKIFTGEVSDINNTVNVYNWSNGVYLVKLSNDGLSQTKRFVKQ